MAKVNIKNINLPFVPLKQVNGIDFNSDLPTGDYWLSMDSHAAACQGLPVWKAGIMKVSRILATGYGVQRFIPYMGDNYYLRGWNPTSKQYDAWKKIAFQP